MYLKDYLIEVKINNSFVSVRKLKVMFNQASKQSPFQVDLFFNREKWATATLFPSTGKLEIRNQELKIPLGGLSLSAEDFDLSLKNISWK